MAQSSWCISETAPVVANAKSIYHLLPDSSDFQKTAYPARKRRTITQAAVGDLTSASKPLIPVVSRPLGSGPTLTGLDVLERENFRRLAGKRVALLTNVSAIDREGRHILDCISGNRNVNLVALFSPEHGLYGNVDTKTSDFKDTATGLMVHSLYSDKREKDQKPNHPAPKDMAGIDVVVIDMQDIGARFYTYSAYMAYMLESCAAARIEAMVLDRPNPIGGLYVDGPVQDLDEFGSVTEYFPMPVAHGMTMGEMARMFNKENRINCKLTVVKCENWTRDMYLDQTGLRWVNPSPNIQDLDAAIVYPGIAITESLVSMGRGTTEPFHLFGTPYIDNAAEFVDALTSGGLEGARLETADFVPTGTLAKDHPGEQKRCRGARLTITDRTTFRPVLLGLRVMDYLEGKYSSKLVEQWKWDAKSKTEKRTGRMIPQYDAMRERGPGSAMVCARIRERKPLDKTMELIDTEVAQFLPVRAKYLLYSEGKN